MAGRAGRCHSPAVARGAGWQSPEPGGAAGHRPPSTLPSVGAEGPPAAQADKVGR